MKNILPVLCLLSVGLISCSSCSETITVPTSTPDAGVTAQPSAEPEPDPTLVTFKGMNFTVPPGWTHAPFCDDQGTCAAVTATSPTEHLLVLGIVEPFNQSLDAYVLFNVQGIKDSGAKIEQANRVTINNEQLVFLESSLNEAVVRTWMTVLDNVGYSLSCGGNSEDIDACNSIVDSLVINP